MLVSTPAFGLTVPSVGDETDTGMLWWILGAGALVALIALVYWWIQRKKQAAPDDPDIEELSVDEVVAEEDVLAQDADTDECDAFDYVELI
jgi:hypothetical protein